MRLHAARRPAVQTAILCWDSLCSSQPTFLEFYYFAQGAGDLIKRHFTRLLVAPPLVFNHALGQALVAEDEAAWDADQVHVGEDDAGAFVAVVEEPLEAGGGELVVELVHRFLHRRRLLVTDRHERDLERRDRIGPDDAVVVVVLLDGGGDDARDADAVAAHGHDDALSGFVEHRGVQLLAVLGAELEDVADLDAAADAEGAAAFARAGIGAGVALDDLADVGDDGLGRIASPVDVHKVLAVYICAADEARKPRGRLIGDHGNLEAHRADGAGLAAGGQLDLAGREEHERFRHLRELRGLDLVQLVIAAQHERNRTAHAFHQQRFDRLKQT